MLGKSDSLDHEPPCQKYQIVYGQKLKIPAIVRSLVTPVRRKTSGREGPESRHHLGNYVPVSKFFLEK